MASIEGTAEWRTENRSDAIASLEMAVAHLLCAGSGQASEDVANAYDSAVAALVALTGQVPGPYEGRRIDFDHDRWLLAEQEVAR